MTDGRAAGRRLQKQQIAGLLLLIGLIVVVSIYRAGLWQVFPRGWWHIW